MMLPIFFQRNLEVGLKSLWHRRLRSLLTVLGIVFGVASVIAMLAIGEGASYEAQQRIKQMGSLNIIVRSVKPPAEAGKSSQPMGIDKYGLLKSDFYRLQTIPSLRQSAQLRRTRETVWQGEWSFPGQLVLTNPSYFQLVSLSLASGRLFNENDYLYRSNVAVLGAGLIQKLFPLGGGLGETVRVKRNYYRVIGILSDRSISGGGSTVSAENVNYEIYIPLSTGMSQFGEFIFKNEGGSVQREWVELHEIVMKAGRESDIPATVSLISAELKRSHKAADYEIMVPLELLKQAEQTKRIFNIVLGSIAAISLLVGGIGIMNIMLASVMERIREIGLRRALGARKRDIVIQFLSEAVILSAIGGAIGVILGIFIPALVTRATGMKTIVTVWSPILAFAISAAIGVIFGFYPARSAAELDPITALRNE
ncbi:MAG: ABC transporter permease [Candidatus Omnitrophota bacterium]|nr:ABC transporter permease [Candidatus Omnitrophota bacterium]